MSCKEEKLEKLVFVLREKSFMHSASMSWLDKLPLIVLREDFFLVN